MTNSTTTFVVQRTFLGTGQGYLHAWDADWGTACMNAISKAMTFATREEAEAAAVRAGSECKGADGKPAKGMVWSVVEVAAPDTGADWEHPDDDRAQRAEQTAEIGTEAMAVVIATSVRPVDGIHIKQTLGRATTEERLIRALRIAVEALDSARGDINPERGYADELEAEISAAYEHGSGLLAELDGRNG